MLMGADADMAPPSHYVELFALLDGGQRDGGWTGEGRPAGGHALAIVPGTTHYDIFASPLFAHTTLAFLDRPTDAGAVGRRVGRATARRRIDRGPASSHRRPSPTRKFPIATVRLDAAPTVGRGRRRRSTGSPTRPGSCWTPR